MLWIAKNAKIGLLLVVPVGLRYSRHLVAKIWCIPSSYSRAAHASLRSSHSWHCSSTSVISQECNRHSLELGLLSQSLRQGLLKLDLKLCECKSSTIVSAPGNRKCSNHCQMSFHDTSWHGTIPLALDRLSCFSLKACSMPQNIKYNLCRVLSSGMATHDCWHVYFAFYYG